MLQKLTRSCCQHGQNPGEDSQARQSPDTQLHGYWDVPEVQKLTGGSGRCRQLISAEQTSMFYTKKKGTRPKEPDDPSRMCELQGGGKDALWCHTWSFPLLWFHHSCYKRLLVIKCPLIRPAINPAESAINSTSCAGHSELKCVLFHALHPSFSSGSDRYGQSETRKGEGRKSSVFPPQTTDFRATTIQIWQYVLTCSSFKVKVNVK